MLLRKLVFTAGLLLACFATCAQRVYKPASVLASGTWYKISVTGPGIYKIDLPFLSKLGINTANIPSSAVQLFGNGGQMLAESNNGPWVDDLRENALLVVDGGDNVLNGSDHILFYANGPDRWIKDSANQRFTHEKNIYSDRSYYFLVIGNNGKRITTSSNSFNPNISVNSFSGRYFHELDTVNLLNSGKEWYGEEFSNLPGRSLTRNFQTGIPAIVNGSALQVRTHCIARSSGAGSSFEIKVNNVSLGTIPVAAVGAGPYDLYARDATHTGTTVIFQNDPLVNYTYAPGSFNAQGWLNWFEVFSRRQLVIPGSGQLLFSDWASVGNNIAEFVIGNTSASTQVWDITDPLSPIRMPTVFSAPNTRFTNSCSMLREYVAFNETGFPEPGAEGRVVNQNLHAATPADHIIIVHPPFLQQAERLARFHEQKNGLRVLIATTEQVYNEFGSGSPDPTAIRDFVKMYHDKYRNDAANRLRYLLLFGDASYDYKDRLANNTNLVPAYENNVSLDVLSTYTTDDYFGFLDDQEDINSGIVINELDIGIGRVPAKNPEEAKNFVDKVETYFSPAAFGPWRNNLSFIADDEDQNLHLQDAEIVSNTAIDVAPVYNLHKIYLDAYPQETGSGGNRYPAANQASNNQVFNGTLIWNFNGHGSAFRLAEENILDQEIVNSWNNSDRLPLFVTATCDFAPYDNPLVNSLGENILLRPKTGAIALMTTTRTVFAFSNRIMNDNYLRIALEPDANGRYRSLGDAVKDAKNFTYQTSADISNNRKFTLLGDPAVTLSFPAIKARPTRINDKPAAQTDTLSAMEKITIEGEIIDHAGNLMLGFNGYIYPAVFDKPQANHTLANDAGSQRVSFNTQTNVLFKGKATVSNGRFSFSFKVPRDINYQFGNGKISLYAEDGSQDGNGSYTGFVVGGTGVDTTGDTEGPDIKPFLNDEKFVNGGTSNETPVLILKLADSSGINTAGTGIGHDIVATLDNDNNQFFVLNDYYQGELDSYQQGTVRFQMPALEPGTHTLKIKAWDVLNNSNEVILEFLVAKDEGLELRHVLNYPNPFTTRTQFWFEHNKPGQDLQVSLQIFTVSGRVIKTFQKAINTPGNRSSELEWDGRDQFGDRVGRGVYFYKLTVIAPGKQRKEKIEKLVLF